MVVKNCDVYHGRKQQNHLKQTKVISVFSKKAIRNGMHHWNKVGVIGTTTLKLQGVSHQDYKDRDEKSIELYKRCGDQTVLLDGTVC